MYCANVCASAPEGPFGQYIALLNICQKGYLYINQLPPKGGMSKGRSSGNILRPAPKGAVCASHYVGVVGFAENNVFGFADYVQST